MYIIIIIVLGCNESNIIFQQRLCKLGQPEMQFTSIRSASITHGAAAVSLSHCSSEAARAEDTAAALHLGGVAEYQETYRTLCLYLSWEEPPRTHSVTLNTRNASALVRMRTTIIRTPLTTR